MERFKIDVYNDEENPPEIPALPYKKDDLIDLSLKKFETIVEGFPDPTFEAGGISTTYRGVKCPFCEMRFIQKVVSGCFNITEEPSWCPNCDFPTNAYKALDKF